MKNTHLRISGRSLLLCASKLVVFVLFAVSVGQSQAAILAWSGNGATTNWNDSGNWGFAGTPTNGDTLIFPGSQPGMTNYNNIPGLTLNQIRFAGVGGGYAIQGNAFTLTNNIEGTNSSGSANVIVNDILFNLDQIIHVTSSVTLSGALSGPVGIVKTGSGTLTLAGGTANTFTGDMTVAAGTLVMGKFGTPGVSVAVANSLIVSNGAVARLTAPWQLYQPYRSLAFSTTLYPNSLLDLNGFNEWLSQVNMCGAQITTGVGVLDLSGNITVISNATVGSVISGNLTLYSYSTCTNNIITNTGSGFTPDLLISATVASSSTNVLIKSGPGVVELRSSSNTYTGATIINGGVLTIDYANGLGNTNSPAVVTPGGSLYLSNNITVSTKPLFLSGAGYSLAALAGFGTNSWTGNIMLTGDGSVAAPSPNNILTLPGIISGPGGLTTAGSGIVELNGLGANTFSGKTTVASGTLELDKVLEVTAVAGDLDIYGILRLEQDYQITNGANVTVESGGLFDFQTFSTPAATLGGAGNVTFGTNGYLTLYGSGNSTFSGVMSGVGFSGGYTLGKVGTGTLTLSGNNNFSAGSIQVNNGGLVVNGSQPGIPVNVASAASLSGTGSVGVVNSSGTVIVGNPTNGVGLLDSGNVTFNGGSKVNFELTGPIAGSQYSQLGVNGNVSISTTTLNLFFNFTNPVTTGQTFTLINNGGSMPIGGTFNGFPEGSLIATNGYFFRLSYLGNDGNDMVLTLTNVPGASAGYAVTSGNGSGGIDPNSCNYLSLVISNQTGTPMTGVSATLASETPNVFVTQPFSSYPTVPGNGTSGNAALFQLATTTNFTCGTPINLNLIIATASHGSFILPITLPSGSPAIVPSRYDVSVITNIPDIGTIQSTNTVSGFVGQIAKVAVSLWLTHPVDSDLTLSLIAPNGASVTLVSDTGSGANFGSACSPDADRTTFDDSGPISIGAGSPPFVGTFRPQSPLSALNGSAANGNWRLQVTDSVGGSVGALRCWSLFLYPLTCPSGGGVCELCPNVTIMGATGPASPTQYNYAIFNANPSVCGVQKTCPGTFTNGPVAEDTYTFRNGPSNACITVTVENDANNNGAMLATVYSLGFDPANPDKCANYLADAGYPIYNGHPVQTFSFNATSNEVFLINLVSDIEGNGVPYRLTVTGGDCRPELNITPAGGNQVQLDWTTAAANYTLETTNQVPSGPANWPVVTNVPSVINSKYVVTNSAPVGSKFYRLHNP